MGVDPSATIAGLDALVLRVDAAVFKTVAEGLHLVQSVAAQKAPRGVVGNSTNYPGDLARSIDVTGPVGAKGTYVGWTGPTVIYGRQRELGGAIYPKTATLLHFVKFGQDVYTNRVYQEPEPYLAPAVWENLANLRALGMRNLRNAVI